MDVTEHGDLTLQRLDQEVLAAYGWPPFGGAFDIRTEWPDAVPTRRGVYVFLDAGGEGITYPIGTSSVVYFGKAEQQRGVRGRVSYHRGRIKSGPSERYPGHPAHEWVMARGGYCLYSIAPERTSEGRLLHSSAGWIESELLSAFQRLHRTRPVGNGTR